MKKRDFETYQKRFRDFEILPNFPRPTFSEVPFDTPSMHLEDLPSVKFTEVGN